MQKTITRLTKPLIIGVIFSLITAHLCLAQEKTYIFGVVPQKAPVDMHTSWQPFMELLARESGLLFELKVYANMDQFEADFQGGAPDFIFASPTQTVLAKACQQYFPLVRASNMLKGILFVKKDSPIETVDQLTNKTVAFVGAKNLCSVFVRDGLSRDMLVYNFIRLYEGSTSNVFKSVILGKADAGATLDLNLKQAPPGTAEQLKIIYTTGPIAPHPISAHPRISQAIREKIRAAVIKIGGTAENEQLMKGIGLVKPLPADYERDYKSIEGIDLKSLTQEK